MMWKYIIKERVWRQKRTEEPKKKLILKATICPACGNNTVVYHGDMKACKKCGCVFITEWYE